jgi:hypothetical protein
MGVRKLNLYGEGVHRSLSDLELVCTCICSQLFIGSDVFFFGRNPGPVTPVYVVNGIRNPERIGTIMTDEGEINWVSE